jgi:photosystem II stability/assembly factor-like uncharacterized protein
MKRLLLIQLLMAVIFFSSDTLIAQWVKWEQTSGPEGGYINSIAEDDSYFYAATFGPIFRRQKNETTWTPLPALNTNVTGASSLAIIGTTLVAGTSGGGVYRSTDHGMTWERWISGLDKGATVLSFAINGNDLFAGTNHGVYLSTDYGANWTPRNTGQNSLLVLCLLTKGSDIFAGTMGGGIYRSVDYGSTWVPVNNGLKSDTTWVLSLAVMDNMLFAGTWQADGVYRSTDNGATWSAVTKNFQNNADRDINSFAILGTTLLAGTFGGIFYSEDTGDNWTRMNSGPGSSVTQFHVSGTNLYAGTGDGVYFSSNTGYSWSSSYTGLIGTVINVLLRFNTTLFAGTASGLFQSDDNGVAWVKKNHPSPDISSLIVSGSDLFAGTGNGVTRSINGGSSWSWANAGNGGVPVTGLAVIPYGSSGKYLFAGTDSNGVILSLDAGAHWAFVNSGLTDTLIRCLCVNGTNLFAGTGSGIFLSTNYGFSWIPVNNGLMDKHIQCIAASGGNIFVGTEDGGVFLSTDNGTNWTPVNTGLEVLNILSLTANDSYLIAGTWFGRAFFSENNGSKWIPVEMGLRDLPILSFDISDTYIFAGIRGAGVYKCPLSGLITSVPPCSSDLSSEFKLEQNFPNPFNNSTKIRFSIPRQTHVVLKILDQSGREVVVLVNKEFAAGIYEELLDRKYLSNGVYYCQMTAGEFIQTRKLVLLK